MTTKQVPTWTWVAGVMAVTLVAAVAFSTADTGARSATASVATDSAAYLAMEANGLSPHKGFVTEEVSGKLSVAFGSGVAGGDGINPDSSYEFNSLINVTNQGSEAIDVSVSFSGVDATLCEAALTTTESQATTDYSDNPPSVALAIGSTAYLGLGFSGSGKSSGDSVACEITLSAS